jgi:predicted enzyme related to lactoylglutathione lyase
MSHRDDYEPGVPSWIDTIQPDPDAAMAFYGALFGWEFAGPGPMGYSVARLHGRDVAGIGSPPPAGSAPPPAWNTYVSVESADGIAETVRSAGGAVLIEPFDVLPAGRLAVLADPAGAAFGAWEPRQRAGAQLVNEPGAWAMSHLDSPDPDAAAAFYGAVFGWTTEAFGEGAGAVTMFRLPGYVGGEPHQPVSREVVATMSATREDGTPGWNVHFWDHDVDATVAKAAELGGSVVAAPFDTPLTRIAVLADPHGAAFAISNVPG